MFLRKAFVFSIAAFAASLGQADAQTIAKNYKEPSHGNPISASVFCADPTAIDYNGRLYVYGTNDHQQFIVNGKKGENGYGNIKSLVVFSTDDLVNWTFHGTIDVGKVCGNWCGQSWAPSAVWRTNASGNDEFFVYFANGGGSVGVIKGTSPVGPFNSPLNNALIRHGMPGVDPCNWVFDPGVVIDDNGVGWIAFGGGDPQSTGSALMPGNSRIAKLKSTMLGLDGAAVDMPAPYLFEASELNMMNGRYVYTYNTSWSGRDAWNSYAGRNGQPAPSTCSMCYMVSDTPLVPSSWQYLGEYVPNEGNFGFGWGNNHTHLQKFEGQYYLFYHSVMLEQSMNTGASGFRSIGVNLATVDEETPHINKITMTRTGVRAIKNLDPYKEQQAETMSTCGGILYEDFTNIVKVPAKNTLGNDASQNLQVKIHTGDWTMVRNADFGEEGASCFKFRTKGTGKLEIRFDGKNAKAKAAVEFSSTAFEDHYIKLDPTVFNDTHHLFFVFTSANNVQFDSWQFLADTPDGIDNVKPEPITNNRYIDLLGRHLYGKNQHRGLVIEQYRDADGNLRSRKVVR